MTEVVKEEKAKKFKRPSKKKVCAFCTDKSSVIDYKDAAKLRRYITSTHQRELAVAIKRARIMALLPFKGE